MPKISALPSLSVIPAGAELAVISGGVTYRATRAALISALFGASGFPYTFSATTTDADPGAGTFRFDSGTIGSITKLFIDLSAYAGGDVSDFLAALDDAAGTIKGYFWYRSLTDPTKWAQFKYTARTAGTGYDKIDVQVVDSGSGGLPTTTAGDTIVTFDAAPSGGIILADGTVAMAAALNMGSHKITSLTDGTSAQDAASFAQVTAARYPPIVTVSASTLTLDATYIGKRIMCTHASGCNITVPENIFAVNEWVDAFATASGQQVTFTQGTNVTINPPVSLDKKTRERYSSARLTCYDASASELFLLEGDLAVL